jgi:hypothetical protein
MHSPSMASAVAPNAVPNAQNACTHLSKESTAKNWNENKVESSSKAPSASLTSAKSPQSTKFPVDIAFFDANDSPSQMKLSNFAQNESGFDDGYDSDGDIGPFYDCIEAEGEQDYNEDGMIPEYFGKEKKNETIGSSNKEANREDNNNANERDTAKDDIFESKK